MPARGFTDLSDLPREEPSGNGHTPEDAERPTLPSFANSFRSTRRAPSEESFAGGRAVNPSGKRSVGFDIWDAEKRPYGREDSTIGALRAIRDFDPQASQAASNFLRLMNPGHDIEAVGINRTGDATNPAPKVGGKAQAIMDDMAERMGSEYGGGADQFHNVLSLILVTQGAVAAEMAPWPDLDDVEDWYPVDPLQLSYKRMPVFPDDKIGKLTLGQKVDGKWSPVNPNQVFHMPLDPDVNEPYGRPPFMAALQTVLSKSMMLNDLRAVAHNQGYPRLDVKVIWDSLMKAAPPNLRDGGRDRTLVAWMQSQLNTIVADYNKLNVDDTYVHYDWVDVGMVGPNYAATSFDFKGFEAILTRQINSSLKMLPILTGYNETTSETHGSIQWQIQIAYIKNLQRLVKRTMENLGNATLRLHGIDARCRIVYKPIRTVDRKFEAESEFLEAKTRQLYQLQGWRDGDDISQELFNEDAKGEPIVPGATGKEPLGTGGSTDSDGNDKGDNASNQRVVDAITSGRENGILEALLADRNPVAAAEARAVVDDFTESIERYAVAGGVIFMQAKEDLIALLEADGTLPSESAEKRDSARDIADYVFGLRFSREMKRLLREAIAEGIAIAGLDIDVPERLVTRIWNQNRPFVERIKQDLKAQLRAGAFRSIEDVNRWFRENAYRETLMGRFLARQGLTAGFAFAIQFDQPAARFIWVLGVAEHCHDCEARSGSVYTFAELESAGFPGSINLDCAANCKCSLIDEG